MRSKSLFLLSLLLLLLTGCATDKSNEKQVSAVEATTPEFKDIPFSETKSIYEVQKENLVLDSACETVTFRGKQYDLGMRQKSGKEVNYFYCEPSWMKLDNKVVLKLAYGAEAPGETLLVFLDPSKGLTTKLELQTGGEYDYKFIHKLTNNHMLAAVNGTLYNIDLASETLLEQYKLKYRDFGDKTKEILVKDASTIEVLRTYEDGSGEFVEKFHPVTALKL